MPVYDREHDEADVPSSLPSAFLGWSEDVEALSIKRWPRWDDFRHEPADFGTFVSGVIRQRMRESYARVSADWRDFRDSYPTWRETGPTMTIDRYGGTYSITRQPLTGWRRYLPAALWRRWRPAPVRYGNFGPHIPLTPPQKDTTA